MEIILKYIVAAVIVLNVLIGLTNIIVEFVKRLTWDKINTNYVAAGVGIALTVTALLIASAVIPFPLRWYYVLSALLQGILVSYGAMVGYDKLWSQLRDIFRKTKDSISDVSDMAGVKKT